MKDMNKLIQLREATHKDMIKGFQERAKDLRMSFERPKRENGMLCDFGCGQPATYMIHGISCCNKYESRCPAYERYQSEKRLEMVGQIPHRKMKDTKFSCFLNYFFHEEWYIHQIINLVKWGSNRVIRQQGFRVLPINQELKPIKTWDRITSPHFIINESMYISQPKGQSIIAVHIGELPYETN